MFVLCCPGHAYQEVVVALLDKPRAYPALRRFALRLMALTTCLILLIAATPLSRFWFGVVSGLNTGLATIARTGLWVGLLLPGLAAFQNWVQGVLVHGRKTRAITESVVVYLVACGAVLWAGTTWLEVTGLYVGMAAFSVGGLVQNFWLYWGEAAGFALRSPRCSKRRDVREGFARLG
jgi:hypothetical protein